MIAFHLGSLDSRGCCTYITEGCLEVRKTEGNPFGAFVKVNVKSTQYCLCVTFRAEREKMNDKMKEGVQQEEVDDSGFFSGKVSSPSCFSL